MGGRRISLKKLRDTTFNTDRMSLISAGSISLDSTFKSSIWDARPVLAIWAENTLMTEFTQERGHLNAVYGTV